MRYSIYYYDGANKAPILDGHTDNERLMINTAKELREMGYKVIIKDFGKPIDTIPLV